MAVAVSHVSCTSIDRTCTCIQGKITWGCCACRSPHKDPFWDQKGRVSNHRYLGICCLANSVSLLCFHCHHLSANPLEHLPIAQHGGRANKQCLLPRLF